MPLARQNARKPLPSSDSLPTFPSHKPGRTASKLSLKILLSRGIYVAGAGKLQGELEVSVKDKALGLGEVGIELNGVEELRNRDHTATRRVIYSRLLFQGPGLPPSNAVQPGSTALQGGYFPALRGRTRFAFTFDLPKDLPSTASFGAQAVVRYELRAFASSLFEGDVDLKSEKKEVLVVERWDDWRKGNWTQGLDKQIEQQVTARADAGLVSLKASIGCDASSGSLPRLFWWRDVDEGVEGKGTVEIRVRIKNTTPRHIAGLRVTLIRRLRLHRDRNRAGPPPPQLSANVTSIDYLGTEHDVRAGSEREMLVNFELPKQECWTGRKGSLFDLDCFVRVQAEGSFLDPKLFVELPVYISHPFSISNTAHRLVASERQALDPRPQHPPSPSVPFLRSPRSTLDFSGSPTHLDFPQHRSPAQYPQDYHSAGSTVSISHSVYPQPAAQTYDQYISSQSRPVYASPEPYSLPVPRDGYAPSNAPVPNLTPSRFLGSLQSQQPGQVYLPPETTMGTSITPFPVHDRQHSPHSPRPPTFAHPPVPPLESHPSLQPSPQYAISPIAQRPSSLPTPPGLPQQTSQSPANEPIEPYSGIGRAHQSPRTASPNPIYSHANYLQSPIAGASTSPPTCPSPAPATYTGPTSLRTPPPPAPSSHFHQISPEHQQRDLLDTIGEDGESQAGTTKSQALTASALATLRDECDDSSSIRSVRVGNSPGRTSVQDLEELVAEEERKHEEGLERAARANQQRPPSAPTRLQDVFHIAGQAVREVDLTSKSPAPSSPSPALSARSEGGLAALQARLARATSPLPLSIPDSRPESTTDKRSNSPSVLEVPRTGSSALRARSISRASRSRDKEVEQALKEAEEDPAEVIKRVMSRASGANGARTDPPLPPNVSSAVFKAVTAMKSLEIADPEAVKVTSQTLERERPQSSDSSRPKPTIAATPRSALPASPRMPVTDDLPARVATPPSRPPSRPIFASPTKRQPPTPIALSAALPPIDLSSPTEPLINMSRDAIMSTSPSSVKAESKLPISPVAHINEQGRKVVDAAEVKQLKKKAVARVGDWLESEAKPASTEISPWSVMHKSNSSQNISRTAKTIEFARQAPPPPTTTLTTKDLLSSVVSDPTRTSATVVETSPEPSAAQLLAAESRTELRRIEATQEKASPVAKGLGEFLAAIKRDEEVPLKDHGASVRGGKGGKVTAVTSIWASREEAAERVPLPNPVLGHQPAKSLSSIDGPSHQPLSSVSNVGTRTNRRSLQVALAPAAKPFLNTTLGRANGTGSLARSTSGNLTRSDSSENEYARGAKVKDLLLRYQQQLS
ncbi:uncharacterized protein JCM15063_002011 [Sporobolomyces koalae]|uniref:uncharacterized protein n=1 Tax=Sporobolomyces koalae TaxID=500713 RepID=UPI003181E65E